eukprot:scaffold6691_cov358-Prasinococcus_capsulatus_cf.AAC.17
MLAGTDGALLLLLARPRQVRPQAGASSSSNPTGPGSNQSLRGLSGLTLRPEDEDLSERKRPGKKLSETELWEAKQLIASGVLSVDEYPTFDEEEGMLGRAAEENEVDFEVELNDAEPTFLRGQTRNSVNVSPIKIVKNPDGSLQRAAMTQGALAKERRELKEQQQRSMLDNVPKDLNR